MSNDKNKLFECLGKYYEILGALIVTVTTILVIHFSSVWITSGKRDVNKNDFSKTKSYIDSANAQRHGNKIDSVYYLLSRQNIYLVDSIIRLNNRVDDMLVDNAETETRIKIMASIISIVFAIVGFFGFKSLNDIREYSLKSISIDVKEAAKNEAKKTAQDVSKEIAEKTAEATAKATSTDISNIVAKETSQNVATDVARSAYNSYIIDYRQFRDSYYSDSESLRRRIERLERHLIADIITPGSGSGGEGSSMGDGSSGNGNDFMNDGGAIGDNKSNPEANPVNGSEKGDNDKGSIEGGNKIV